MAETKISQTLESGHPYQIGYFIFRITLGMNMVFHGLMRLTSDLSAWEDSVAIQFTDTFLPMPLVHGFLYALPVLQLAFGALTLLGFLTKWSLVGGALLILILVFGNGARMQFASMGNNMLYAVYYYILIVRLNDNWIALDCRRTKINVEATDPHQQPA